MQWREGRVTTKCGWEITDFTDYTDRPASEMAAAANLSRRRERQLGVDDLALPSIFQRPSLASGLRTGT